MDHQEMRDELAAADGLMGTTSAAHLAYTATDGTPRVVPVGYFWTGEVFVVATHPVSPKLAALAEHADVALAVDGGGTPGDARALSVRGTADVTIVDGVVPEYLEAAYKSMEPAAAAEFEEQVRATYDRQARIAITPTWARFWDFGAGRLPGSLQAYLDRDRSAAG